MVMLCAGLAALAVGCESRVSVAPDPRALRQSAPYTYTDEDYALVLRNHVHDGLVDYAGLARDREPLDRYYALLGVTGPSRTPGQFTGAAHANAYWINAYNALVMLFVLQHFPSDTIYDVSIPKIELATFRVDGRVYTLPEIESRILQTGDGDVRALFATHRASLGTPRLFSEPIRAILLERQLADAAANALNNPRIMRIDHTARQILIWQVVLARKDDFERYYCVRRRTQSAHLLSVLMDMASAERRRALQSAVGYPFQTMPFERRLNHWGAGSEMLNGGRPLVP